MYLRPTGIRAIGPLVGIGMTSSTVQSTMNAPHTSQRRLGFSNHWNIRDPRQDSASANAKQGITMDLRVKNEGKEEGRGGRQRCVRSRPFWGCQTSEVLRLRKVAPLMCSSFS